MKKSLILVLLAAAALLLPAGAAAGGWSPLQLALWHPAQLVGEDTAIYGLRANLFYGKNKTVWGLDLGIANTTSGRVGGIQAGLINGPGALGGIGVGAVNSARRVDGLQAGILSVAEDTVNGGQVSAVYNKGRSVRGVQIGLFN
ncbi:MAG TPA: hypothetical protein VKO20_07855, partial [Desulfosalsimonadaceae bacterium]|nr:hypothetical protein [Desulfosalsimonadaceae bacterium]